MVITTRNTKYDSTDVLSDVVDLIKSPLSEAKLALKMEEEAEKEKQGKRKTKRKNGKEKDHRPRCPSRSFKNPTKKDIAASRPGQTKLGNFFGNGKATKVKNEGRMMVIGRRGENEGDTSEEGKGEGKNMGEKVGDVKCPNCGKAYEKRELEAHLKSCGEPKSESEDDNEEEGERSEYRQVMLKKDVKKHLKGCAKRKRGSGDEEEHEEGDEKNEAARRKGKGSAEQDEKAKRDEELRRRGGKWCGRCDTMVGRNDIVRHEVSCHGRVRNGQKEDVKPNGKTPGKAGHVPDLSHCLRCDKAFEDACTLEEHGKSCKGRAEVNKVAENGEDKDLKCVHCGMLETSARYAIFCGHKDDSPMAENEGNGGADHHLALGDKTAVWENRKQDVLHCLQCGKAFFESFWGWHVHQNCCRKYVQKLERVQLELKPISYDKGKPFWCQRCERQFLKEEVTKHSAVCKERARWGSEGHQDVQGNNDPPTFQVRDLPIPDGRPRQDSKADSFDIFHHLWPPSADTPPSETTPHKPTTLRAATDTLLKGVHHRGDVLDNAVGAIFESRDDLPFIVVRQEDREGRGDAWEAYTLWPSLAFQVDVAGRICGFPHYSYVGRATNDERCGYVDPKVVEHIEMEKEGCVASTAREISLKKKFVEQFLWKGSGRRTYLPSSRGGSDAKREVPDNFGGLLPLELRKRTCHTRSSCS